MAQSNKSQNKGLLGRIRSFFGGESPSSGQSSQGSRNGNQPAAKRRTRHAGGGQSKGGGNNGGGGGGRNRSRGGGGGGGKRGPELREVTGTRLYVGNLSYDATEDDLEELFRGVGTVESAEVVTHSRTQRSKGFAFVEMSATDQAKRAAEQLHDTEFMGRKLVVTGAKPIEARA